MKAFRTAGVVSVLVALLAWSPAAHAAARVVIRGVTLKALTPGIGNGMDFQSGKNISIESCVLDSWSAGILVTGPNSPNASVLDTIVRNGDVGILSGVDSGFANVVVHNSRFENHASCAVLALSDSSISAQATITSGGADPAFAPLAGYSTVRAAWRRVTVWPALGH